MSKKGETIDESRDMVGESTSQKGENLGLLLL